MSETKIKKPIWKKWWFWVIVVIVLIAIASSGDNEEVTLTNEESVVAEEAVEGEEVEEELPRVFEGDLKLEVKDNKVIMTVNSNVPDGGLFELAIMTADFNAQSEVVAIENGEIVHEFEIPDDWGIGYISGTAMFRFNLEDHPQPDHIKEIYGENGEKMEGELVVENNLGGYNGNIEPVTVAYPDEETVKAELERVFNETIKETIKASGGVILDIQPLDPDDWEIVYVFVSDDWYFSPHHEKERFVEQIGEALENLVINAGMTSGNHVSVYFKDSHGKDLASPKIFGGYDIKR